jgi:hypothetical protein
MRIFAPAASVIVLAVVGFAQTAPESNLARDGIRAEVLADKNLTTAATEQSAPSIQSQTQR